MTGDLSVSLELTEHYNPEFKGIYLDPWGRFTFTHTQDGRTITLLDWQWGLDELAEGFAENRDALRTEELSVVGEMTLPGESLAQARTRFRDRDAFADQEEFNEFYSRIWPYFKRHCPKSWMVGVAMPDIVLGLNRGVGEISLVIEQESWAYTFDMNLFVERFRREVIRILSTWLIATESLADAMGYKVGRPRMQRCLSALEERHLDTPTQ